MRKFAYSSKQVRLKLLAELVLAEVMAQPEIAFAASLSRRIPPMVSTQPRTGHEMDVGTSLRYLVRREMVTYREVLNPEGPRGRVKVYKLTAKGRAELSRQKRVVSDTNTT